MKKKAALLNSVLYVFLTAIGSFSCKEAPDVHVTLLPPVTGAELQFRGFVTDQEDELVGKIYNFTRTVVRQDTVEGHPVYVYASNANETPFYTSEDGTVWEYATDEISKRIWTYGLNTRQPITASYWKINLKMDEGVGTSWSFSVDTTFAATSTKGEQVKIRYVNKGKARFAGWSEAFIPESYRYERVLEAYWHELNTFIVNQTTGDTLFVSEGTANHYFDPLLGGVKFISDYRKSEINKPTAAFKGTWELMKKQIPE